MFRSIKIRSIKIALVGVILLVHSSCSSVPTQTEAGNFGKGSQDGNAVKAVAQPAVLVKTSEATTAVLNAAVSHALHGRKVLLAGDVFTRSPEMMLERDAHSRVTMQGMNGRLMAGPEAAYRFSLLVRAGQCFLRREDTGQEQRLAAVTCRAL